MKTFHVSMPMKHHAGDAICLLSTCRLMVEMLDCDVTVENIRDVVAAYKCPRLRFAQDGEPLVVPRTVTTNPRNKEPGKFVNYAGIYMDALGLPVGEHPRLVLPRFEPEEPKVLIQPWAYTAPNPPEKFIQGVVDAFVEETGIRPYVVGSADTKTFLHNVRYDLVQTSLPALMRHIQSASFVMTPRSLSAHVAAGYGRPAFVWCPDDGENWHLEYEGWRKTLCGFKVGVDGAKRMLKNAVQMMQRAASGPG